MTNSDYILFLDESSVTRTNPYLLLGGIIISRNDYKKVLIPSIQDTKSILGNSNIVFHYTDILKKQNGFNHHVLYGIFYHLVIDKYSQNICFPFCRIV